MTAGRRRQKLPICQRRMFRTMQTRRSFVQSASGFAYARFTAEAVGSYRTGRRLWLYGDKWGGTGLGALCEGRISQCCGFTRLSGCSNSALAWGSMLCETSRMAHDLTHSVARDRAAPKLALVSLIA